MGYHRGTVWPHDNSLIAAGLTRYGRRAEAGTLAAALLESAPYFDFRLPEAFVGTDREAVPVPVPYPTACSPQAWAPAVVGRSMVDKHGPDPRAGPTPLPFGAAAFRPTEPPFPLASIAFTM